MEKSIENTEAFCPYYHRAMELIGRRWTGVILRAMMSGVQRFSDLAAVIPGLSDRMLSERLKELEVEGLVQRTVIPEIPVRIEYHLTEKGRALGDVMGAVSQWAHDWLALAEQERAEDHCLEDEDRETVAVAEGR
ncbi:MAG TPA: helix-turn-helix domain-containing protein [Chloroflexota bacterium]